jgi:hypothetical protein
MLEPPFDLSLYGRIHLSRKQGLAHVSGVMLGEVSLILGTILLVFLYAIAHALKLDLQILQPLLLPRDKLLV